MPEIGIFVDFGSTYTKVVAIDLDEEKITAQGLAASTVKTDITDGLKTALVHITKSGIKKPIEESSIRLACSSAAGGLRLVVIGLVPNLSLKAGTLAALGAGAKLVGNYSYKLNQTEISQIRELSPDIILLVGGTDGGNEEVIIHNAKVLAKSGIPSPVVIAGNKVCADDVRTILETNQRCLKVVNNVLCELDKLNVEPSRTAIREIFMERIVHTKGLDKAAALINDVVMPTPMAVLKAAELLSVGTARETGLGEIIVVDIGGATTDVHSIAQGDARDTRVIRRGIPEPFAKRTVEGDLGIRYNAMSILETAGEQSLSKSCAKQDISVNMRNKIEYLCEHVDTVPIEDEDFRLDTGLARVATELAVERHAGHLEQIYSPHGTMFIQFGKDLTEVGTIIGTGGIFAYGHEPLYILEGALFSHENPMSLKPKSPQFFVDTHYILFALGLLAEKSPDKALRIGKKYLKKISQSDE